MKRIFILALLLIGGSFLLYSDTFEVSADKKIPDGVTGSSNVAGGEATNIKDTVLKNMWLNGKSKPTSKEGNVSFRLGGKSEIDGFSMQSGRKLIYDIYEGKTSSALKRGITQTASGNYITVDGFSIQYGHHHHRKRNQATYIGLENVRDAADKKLYKAPVRNSKQTMSDEVKTHSSPWCGSNVYNRSGMNCNMHYEYTQFRAYIPLNDLFKGADAGKEWKAYLIMRVDDNILYDDLILPFNSKSYNWKDGKVSIGSGKNFDVVTMDSPNTLKRTNANLTGSEPFPYRYFAPGRNYNRTNVSESYGVSTRIQVLDAVPKKKTKIGQFEYQATNKRKWTTSPYWVYGGDQATIKYTKTKFDVTINHIDKSNGKNIVVKTETKKGLSGSQTFKPYPKGELKDGTGHDLKPIGGNQTVTVNKDLTINFEYKSVIPDPSRIVEVGGGENTHGHATGQAFWELTKKGLDRDLPTGFEEDFEWIDVTDGVEITNYTGERTGLAIPSMLDDKNVVSIGGNAFLDGSLETVIIPNTVKTIRDNAFKDNMLESVGIPNSVTHIGDNAFQNNNLYSIVLPNSIESIGNHAFRDNHITDIEFHKGLRTVGTGAFQNNKLRELVLPESVDTVNPDAFRNNNIEEVFVLNNHTFFANNVFADNQSNSRDLLITGYDPSTAKTYAEQHNHLFESFVNPENEFVWREITGGVEITRYIGNDEVVGIPRTLGGKNVASLGVNSFSEKQLSNVILPNSVTMIGDYAFEDNNLTNINIPNSVTSIGISAFENNQLSEISIPNSVSTLKGFAFRDNNIVSLNLSNSITEIGDYTFENNLIEKVTLPSSMTTIGERAFSENTIHELVINDKLKTIHAHAFSYNELAEVELPESVKLIEDNAFGNNEISIVTILSKELDFDGDAFKFNQSEPTDLTFYGFSDSTTKPFAENLHYTFVSIDKLVDYEYDLHDNHVAITNYKGTDVVIEIPSIIKGLPVTMIESGAFENKGIYSVKIPDSVTEIKADSFKGNHLTELELPNHLTTISDNSFEDNNIVRIVLPKSITDVGNGTFKNNKLEMIVVENANANLKEDTFSDNQVVAQELTIYGHLTSTASDLADNEGYTFKDVQLYYDDLFGEGGLAFKGAIPTRVLSSVIEQSELESESRESELYAEANFNKSGVHYETRNDRHTMKLKSFHKVQKDPIAHLTDVADTKNKDFSYNYEYEYTNHYEVSYTCTEKSGSDCFKWSVKDYQPVWASPFAKEFSLAETEGSFEHFTTSRLAKIKNADVLIYSSPTSSNGTKAGSGKVDHSYYVKEKAIKGNDVFFLLSNGASVGSTYEDKTIGWVNELDVSSYTHLPMDSKNKVVKLTGSGSYFNRIWGGGNQNKGSLSSRKNTDFHVNLTETVGDNIWYRGKFKGSGSNYWIHENYTDTVEMPIIKHHQETKIKGNNDVGDMSLVMDHHHNEIFEFDASDEEQNENLVIGGSHEFESHQHIRDKQEEEFNIDFNDTKLYTQTWKEIDENIKYRSDLDNQLYVIDGDKYYFVDDLDENLREKYENNTNFDKGNYAIPLRLGDISTNEATFLSNDNFFVMKKSGLVFSVPNEEKSSIVIDNEAKEVFENVTGEGYNDIVLGNPFDASRYYVNIDLQSEQEINTKYDDNAVIGGLGLNDITVHLNKSIEFEHYMFGHVKDDSVFLLQRTSIIPRSKIDYQKSVILTSNQIRDLKKLESSRSDFKVHSLKRVDGKAVYQKVRDIINRYEE